MGNCSELRVFPVILGGMAKSNREPPLRQDSEVRNISFLGGKILKEEEETEHGSRKALQREKAYRNAWHILMMQGQATKVKEQPTALLSWLFQGLHERMKQRGKGSPNQ